MTTAPKPEADEICRYDYLWHRQHEAGEIEGASAGLDGISLWVMLDEYNHEILEGSF